MSFLDSIKSIKIKVRDFFRWGHSNSAVVSTSDAVEVKPNQKAKEITNNFYFGEASKQALKNFSPESARQLREDNVKVLDEKISEVPKEHLQEIDTYKTDKALQKLQNVSEGVLVDMFAELIAKAADKRYSNEVVPRYQEILSSLSPSDAKLLEFIYKRGYIISGKVGDFMEFMEELKPYPVESAYNHSIDGIPFLKIDRITEKGKTQFIPINYIFTDLSKIHCVERPSYESFSAQIKHLESLGLLLVSTIEHFAIPYGHLENHSYISNLKANLKESAEIKITKGRIALTDLGKSFLKIVLKENNNPK